MNILSVQLSDFRNYKTASINLDGGLNVLYGLNASGKTNMLESIYISSVFRSPRTTRDKELVFIGKNSASVKIILQKQFRKHTIMLQIDQQGKKRVAVDNIPVNRAGELLGVLGVVFFSPDEMKLVKESPQERRRFMDVGLSQQQRSYFQALQRYNKTLKQKNNLLKDYRDSRNIDDMLDVWDAGLAKEGAIIVQKRTQYVKILNEAAAKFHARLSSDKEKLNLEYECGIPVDEELSHIEERLLCTIKAAREKDRRLGFCSVGPHRDDIGIQINGKDSRKFASQGQQRTIALAMKLGEVVIFKNEIGEPPVLLLDDVLSELDETRQTLLLELTSEFQTVLTCTEYTLPNPAKKFVVCDGSIKEDN